MAGMGSKVVAAGWTSHEIEMRRVARLRETHHQIKPQQWHVLSKKLTGVPKFSERFVSNVCSEQVSH